jgi:hypothetical protein
MPERITITVAAGGDDAEARAFSAVFQDILDLLDSLADERYQNSSKIIWRIVSLQKNSPPSITLESKTRRKLAAVLISGLTAIQTNGRRPFGMNSMKIARRIGERCESRQVDAIVLKSGRAEFKPTPELASNADKLITANFYDMPSSVDGKLEIVNVHAGPKFSIFDDITRREIRCRFPESMLEQVRKNLGKKITASGIVRFNSSTDSPTAINVDEIETLEADESIPSLEEMPVINVTGGSMSAEEFIRNQRDGR